MRSPSRSVLYVIATTTILGALLPAVLAHGDEAMDMGGTVDIGVQEVEPDLGQYPPTYFSHAEYRGLLVAHIVFMLLGWVVLLPVATMLSLASSQYALATQFSFLCANAVGVLLSTMYNAKTPDLYPNNAHHKLGWVVTWLMSAHVLVSLLGRFTGALDRERTGIAQTAECQRFFPVSHAAIEEHHRLHGARYSPSCRTSHDSGQGTDVRTESLRSHSISSVPDSLATPNGETVHTECHHHQRQQEKKDNDDGDDDDDDDDEYEDFTAVFPATQRSRSRRKFAAQVRSVISGRSWKAVRLCYGFVDRVSMILGFITLCTGIIAYGRLFEGRNIYTGLAHWIKGGVFFWMGIFTLGRWAGSFGELGWAWNVKPKNTSHKWSPSAEFVESALIFTYGATNIFLEHLGSSDGQWTSQDLEHVSITVLFIGGGLFGMLVESTYIRDLLNTTVAEAMCQSHDEEHDCRAAAGEPQIYKFSMNPIPALVILLLGIMMSSHSQQSMISSMIHKQWGNLLTGASFSRTLSYIVTYLKPPTSVLPSRPPTELLTSFGLMAGGVIFMASSKDTVDAMVHQQLDAMFMYTVTTGLIGLFMAWELVLLAIKGWAVRKEGRSSHHPLPERYFTA